MIVEGLVIKGLFAIGHWAAAHASAGALAAVVHATAGMTLGQLVATTITAGFVVGGVTWTADKIANVKNGLKAIDDGNYIKAIAEFGKFARSANVDIDMLPDTIEEGLEKMGLDSDGTRKVTSWVKEHEMEIARYARNNK